MESFTYQGSLCTNCSREKSCARLCFNLPVAVPPMAKTLTVTVTGSVGLGAIAVIQAIAKPSLSDTVRDVELKPTITRGEKEILKTGWQSTGKHLKILTNLGSFVL